jgi:hypothetical protein
VDGKRIEILWISFTEIMRSEERFGRKLYSPSFFGQTDAPLSRDLARLLFEHLAKLTGAPELSVRIRNDMMHFGDDGGFPPLYPFEGREIRIPTEEEYLKTPVAGCTGDEVGVGCACIRCEAE